MLMVDGDGIFGKNESDFDQSELAKVDPLLVSCQLSSGHRFLTH
jgi:hypothetical protein